MPGDDWRRLADTFLPVIKRRDADAKLSAELGDGQIRGLLSSELATPPLAAMFTTRRLTERGHDVSPDTASDAVRGQTTCLAIILPPPHHTRFGAKLPCLARRVRSGAYDFLAKYGAEGNAVIWPQNVHLLALGSSAQEALIKHGMYATAILMEFKESAPALVKASHRGVLRMGALGHALKEEKRMRYAPVFYSIMGEGGEEAINFIWDRYGELKKR
jgi:hypothetical protein